MSGHKGNGLVDVVRVLVVEVSRDYFKVSLLNISLVSAETA